jgi:hypothetical protein
MISQSLKIRNMKAKLTVLMVAAILAVALPVAAQTTAPAPTTGTTRPSAATQTRIANAIKKADQEITRRITALTDLTTKVQAMTKVSATEQSSIANMAQSETANLTTLKAKIDADTDITTLKADVKSIATDYRIFMLVIPQGRIYVASDKIQTAIDSYTAFAGKLQTRISDAQTAGKDMTAASASLADMNAKIADATTQANAAISHVANLQPDQGVQATMQANTAAIKQARADMQVALADLKTARKDAGSIVKAVQGTEPSATSTSTTTQ